MSNHIFRKSHYIWLSSFIRDERHITKSAPEPYSYTHTTLSAIRLAMELKDENSNFNPRLFLKNCEISEQEINTIGILSDTDMGKFVTEIFQKETLYV